MKKQLFTAVALLMAVWTVPELPAQSAAFFSVPWSSIDPGWGMSTGQVYSITGRIIDTDPFTVTGGVYTVSGSLLGALPSTSTPPPSDPRILVANLPPNTAIINIDARADGAAAYNSDQSLWYQPFDTAGKPLQYTVSPGTYSFRVINPSDAARLFPTLTSNQTSQIFTAWTYNTPWILDYLVFDIAAATNHSLPQLFDGDPEWPPFSNPTDVYNASLAHGTYDEIRVGPQGRNSTNLVTSYTFATSTTLIFAVPDYGLGDNSGGVSVLVSPAAPTPPDTRIMVDNLPANTAIINIDARANGSATFSTDKSLWYQPFNTSGQLVQYTVSPGTYSFQVINPTDATRLFPALTPQQSNQIYTAWTFNSPWLTEYLVFDAAARTNSTLTQLFDGSFSAMTFPDPLGAYNSATAGGFAGSIRVAGSTNAVSSYTFTSTTTLIFVVPDNLLSDNAGGVSVLVSPAPATTLADGTIVYCRHNPTTDATTVWFANPQFGTDFLVTTGWMAHVSLDRRYLVFLRDGPNGRAYNSRGDVWVRDLSTSLETKLFSDQDYVVVADISRDAFTVFFDYSCSDYSIPRDNSASGNATYLSGGSCWDDGPAVNPVDGRIAYFNNASGGGIGIASTNFQNKAMIPNAALGTYPLWSHDGQWLSYTLTSGYYTYSGKDLYKIQADGSGRTQLTFLTNSLDAFPLGAAWVGGDTALLGAGTVNGTNGMYFVAVDGSGAISPLTSLQPGDPIEYVGTVLGAVVPPMRLGVAKGIAGTVSLVWSGANVALETAPLPSGPWVQVTGASSPFVLSPKDTQGFFRLHKQ